MKVASLSEFRALQEERSLLKTASLTEQMIFMEMKKVAQYGTEEEILHLMGRYQEMEKEGGIIAKGYNLMSKGLARLGKMTGSARVTSAAGKASDAAAKRYSSAAVNPRNMNQFAKTEEYGRLAGEAGRRGREQVQAAKQIRDRAGKTPGQIMFEGTKKAPTPNNPDIVFNPPKATAPPKPPPPKTPPAGGGGSAATTNFANMSDDALKAAADGGDEAAKRALAKRLGSNPATPPATTPPTKPSYNTGGGSDAAIARAAQEGTEEAAKSKWKRNLLLGGGALGGIVGTGYAASKLDSLGRQQNVQQSQRGFNYGVQ